MLGIELVRLWSDWNLPVSGALLVEQVRRRL